MKEVRQASRVSSSLLSTEGAQSCECRTETCHQPVSVCVSVSECGVCVCVCV